MKSKTYRGDLYYGNFLDAFFRGGWGPYSNHEDAFLQVAENGIHMTLGASNNPKSYTIRDIGYDEIVSVQQNYFRYIKIKTTGAEKSIAFNCRDNESLLETLKQRGVSSEKFLPAKIIPKYVSTGLFIFLAVIIVVMLAVFIGYAF